MLFPVQTSSAVVDACLDSADDGDMDEAEYEVSLRKIEALKTEALEEIRACARAYEHAFARLRPDYKFVDFE